MFTFLIIYSWFPINAHMALFVIIFRDLSLIVAWFMWLILFFESSLILSINIIVSTPTFAPASAISLFSFVVSICHFIIVLNK